MKYYVTEKTSEGEDNMTHFAPVDEKSFKEHDSKDLFQDALREYYKNDVLIVEMVSFVHNCGFQGYIVYYVDGTRKTIRAQWLKLMEEKVHV